VGVLSILAKVKTVLIRTDCVNGLVVPTVLSPPDQSLTQESKYSVYSFESIESGLKPWVQCVLRCGLGNAEFNIGEPNPISKGFIEKFTH
jgi:hypothetical protein